jgi:hypothetical protein
MARRDRPTEDGGPEIITFVVMYEDGRTAGMIIRRGHLRPGNHVPRLIAREKQRAGELPKGKIVDIRRQIEGASVRTRSADEAPRVRRHERIPTALVSDQAGPTLHLRISQAN